MKKLVCIVLGLTLFYQQTVIASGVNNQKNKGFVSTLDIVNDFDMEKTKTEIKDLTQKEEVKEKLLALGVTESNIDTRLANMSGAELQTLNSQIHQAQAGGLLVEILLVILIIYFAQRV